MPVRPALYDIYTPSAPETNSAYTLTVSGFKAIAKEVELAYKICQDGLEPLFEDLDFFQQFALYIRVNLYAMSEGVLKEFQGLVSSRFKWLITAIENLFPKAEVRPYTVGFSIESEEFKFGSAYFIGISANGHYPQMNFGEVVPQFCTQLAEMQREEESHFQVSLQNRHNIEEGIRAQLK